MADSSIEWTDKVWNPVTGCTKVSPGCSSCYAKRITERFGGDFSQIILHQDRLTKPLRWRKPRRVFVNSMSDLFHKDVPAAFILDCFEVMTACPQHTFQILTKRPERAESVLYGEEGNFYLGGGDWYPNIHLGFSAEDQTSFDRRWAAFLRKPNERVAWSYVMTVWASLEPLLGPIVLPWSALHGYGESHLRWVVIGCESGQHRRPMQQAWAESIIEQCHAAGVPVFVKQIEVDGRVERDIEKFPRHLQVREYPGEMKGEACGTQQRQL